MVGLIGKACFGLAVGCTGNARFGVEVALGRFRGRLDSALAVGCTWKAPRMARFGVSSGLHWEGPIRRRLACSIEVTLGRLDSP